ncbi:hypothetical protein B0H13DRAFT_1878163 [Mycena leptocephala]|nr:hypothetical protein B0H13DRAFT_1878163 [Mycena leptocephala]
MSRRYLSVLEFYYCLDYLKLSVYAATAFSTAKRNGLSTINIINMGILKKYWKYGFNNSCVYTHSARLILDSFDTTTQPPTRTLPVPTLQDLLNPVPLDPSVSDEAEALFLKIRILTGTQLSRRTKKIKNSRDRQLFTHWMPLGLPLKNSSKKGPARKAGLKKTTSTYTEPVWSAKDASWTEDNDGRTSSKGGTLTVRLDDDTMVAALCLSKHKTVVPTDVKGVFKQSCAPELNHGSELAGVGWVEFHG